MRPAMRPKKHGECYLKCNGLCRLPMREAQENQYISEVHSPWKIGVDVESRRKIRLFPMEWLQRSYSSFSVVHPGNTKNVCRDNCLSDPIEVGNLDRQSRSDLTFPTDALILYRQRLYKLSDRIEPEFIRVMNSWTQRLCTLHRIRLS